MAKAQPKVGDILEILLLEIAELNSQINKNELAQNNLGSKINNLTIKVDASQIKILQDQHQLRYEKHYQNFFRDLKNSTDNFLKINNALKFKTIRYIVIFNLILLVGFGISVYVAGSNSDFKSRYMQSELDKNIYRDKFYNLVNYFEQNPKEKESYLKWKKKHK